MNLEGQMPVAGGLETIAIQLQKEGHCMPWSYMGDKPKPLPSLRLSGPLSAFLGLSKPASQTHSQPASQLADSASQPASNS